MNESILTKVPSRMKIRAELEVMVVGDLLSPACGDKEELTEATVKNRYIFGVLARARGAVGIEGRGSREEAPRIERTSAVILTSDK